MFENIFQNKIINSKNSISVMGLNENLQIEYIWNLFNKTQSNLIVITSTLYEANKIYSNISNYSSNNVLFFPMDDFLISQVLATSPDLMVKRIETLTNIAKSDKKKIIITNLMGYLRFLPSKKLWNDSFITLEKGKSYNIDDLLLKLDNIGYKKETIVTKTGEYSKKGYILDIFPFNYENPCRIELFDDEIEEIRIFDATTQLSIDKISELTISPFTELIFDKKPTENTKMQSYIKEVNDLVFNLSDYLESKLNIYIDLEGIKLSYNNIINEIYELNKYKKNKEFMFDLYDKIPNKYLNILKSDNYIDSNNVEKYLSKQVDCFNGNYNLLNRYINKLICNKYNVVVFLEKQLLIDEFINNVEKKCVLTNENDIKSNYINIVKKKRIGGFILNKTAYLTIKEIYNKNTEIKYNTKYKYGSKVTDVNKLKIGDYVVHSSFGIGKYLGIKSLTMKDIKKDYIYIEYKDKDKLYVPAEKIEYISKYSSKEGVKPNLSKLGGVEFSKQKAKIRGKASSIAKNLLELSAKRKLIKGFSFLPDDEEQYIFEKNFEYEETKDQLRAIKEIKEDMLKPYPMDRLLCGDVGFGKTEVAFRAAFKAIKSGKQVAFLCPTTILSKQHYENAVSRFSGFGVNIAFLNRFVSSLSKKNILNDLKTGKLDLIIATHILLGKDIVYKDLGLLIIDEEQRFGVKHKEQIKKQAQNVDVLTLSATPIPRTLQMSLTGIRGLSLLETPPSFRYPIETYVLRENDQIIKDAIYKELSRNGQVYILSNDIKNLDKQFSRIQNLVSEAKICIIHGKMDKDKIEKTMSAFLNHEYDVLLCTTIIETGIDIKNVNTLIIFDSDHFGLSQLYQIRGRIGRSNKIAYAYLMYKKNKELSDISVKRLNAIKEFTELGSGYALAVRDLSIRGAGNILGKEQSGFINLVGYEMYLKILNEEIEKLKGKEIKEKEYNQKSLIQVSTSINDKYGLSEDMKIEIHKKINTINSYEKLIEIKKELEDRFGIKDESLYVYMLEELFEYKSSNVGITKVVQNNKEIIMYFSILKSNEINIGELFPKLYSLSKNFEVGYNGKILNIKLKIKGLSKHFMYYLIKMINIIE